MGVVVGYARVSSTDQSLEVQLDQLKAAGCTKIFSEQKSGAVLETRSELERCLAYVRDGDTLVVTRLDRFSRSVRHFSKMIDDLQSRGVEFKCLLQPFDTTSSTGKLMMTLLAAFAEFETTVRAERQKEGIAKAQAAGVYAARRDAHGRTRQKWSAASRLMRAGWSYDYVAKRTGISADQLRRKYPGYNERNYTPRRPGDKVIPGKVKRPVEPPPPESAPVECETPAPKSSFLGAIFGR